MTTSIAEILDEAAIQRVLAPLERAWTLPPAAYVNPATFEAEKATLFTGDWVCAAHVSQLRDPGDYVCVDLAGQPVVVVRGRDGTLRALSSVCLHRAMPVIEGQGHATRFVCPYHSWTYELDGRVRSAPMMDGSQVFQRHGCRLPAFAVEVWAGFVFVSRAPRGSLCGSLGGLAEALRHYPLERLGIAVTLEFDSPWNWKILVENFMEAYHHIATHRSSLEPVYPARLAQVPDNGGEPWALLRMPARPPTGADALEPSPWPAFPELDESEQHQLLAACVFPTFLLAASAGTVFWYQLEPDAGDHMRLRIHVLVDGDLCAALDADTKAALAEQVRLVHEEDIRANLGVWRGLQAPAARQGPLSPHEKAIWQLNRLWVDRLSW